MDPGPTKGGGRLEGIGVTFLEETFSASSPAVHRLHRAPRAYWLSPENDADIKGHMRSYGELLDVSGYTLRPADFQELLRILDSELHIITPCDPEGLSGERELPSGTNPDQARYFQLAHDYLVGALRQWLTRQQRETARGRAELCLVDRAALWNARPARRYLPSWFEWARSCS